MSTTILHLFLELLAAADGRFGDWQSVLLLGKRKAGIPPGLHYDL